MRIAHVSDLHIRNFKYRNEYNTAFHDLYGQLDLLKPDLIINTGDTVHSKLAVSPELFDDVANHMLAVSSIAPYWMILGNHDLNLKNVARTDAISPIVRALQGRTENELKLLDAGKHILFRRGSWPSCYRRFRFWNYDIRGHVQFDVNDAYINIGLYHGSLSGCVTDIGFTMEEGEAEVSKFDSMDYVMLGDIHKRQSFRGGRIQYPGSLIQQNYGEELVKGFLLWDIDDRDSFRVDFHQIQTSGRFFTIQVPQTLDLTGINIPSGSRVKALVEGGLTPSRRMKLEEDITKAFSPIEIIVPDSSDEMAAEPVDIDELVGSREKLMREHLEGAGATPSEIDEAIKLFRQYESSLDSDASTRGTTWQLQRIAWDNMMNYGEGNSIDFTKLSGLIGIFGPNAIGKSSIFDIMLEALFDKVSKDVPRNVDLVNDNKDIGSMVVEFTSAGRPFSIERAIERIQYGQRKLPELKQWGKTTLDFSSVDDSLNGTTRPETEREIRQIIGSFEDFVLTAMLSQNPIFGLPGGADILNCKETDRRKILFRFLDLDVYERIATAAKDDLRELSGKLRQLNGDELKGRLIDLRRDRDSVEKAISTNRSIFNALDSERQQAEQTLSRINANDISSLALEQKKLISRLASEKNSLSSAIRHETEQVELLHRLDRQREEHSENRPDQPPVTLEQLHNMLGQVRSDREQAATELSRTDQRLKQGRKSLATLDDIPCEGKYPTCRFIAEASSFVGQREELETALSNLMTKRDDASLQISSLESYEVMHKEIGRWQQKLTDLQFAALKCQQACILASAEVNKAIAAVELTSARLIELEGALKESSVNEITEISASLQSMQGRISALRDVVDRGLRSIGVIDEKIERADADLKSLEGLAMRVSAYERVLEMCGKDGLPYRILSLVLPVINAEIAKILSGVVKFNVFFEAEPDDQTVSLFIRYGDYRSRPLSLGSGAEKFISSLAIRVALLSVSSLPKTDILIIDEGFGKLDPEHLEALQRMFEYLREAFGSVFIVSHVDSMRDIVDHSIEISSQDGYAHVEVE